MSCKLNRKAYVQLIEEDVKWLKDNTSDCLEQDHVLQVLSHSVVCYYPEPRLIDEPEQRIRVLTAAIESHVKEAMELREEIKHQRRRAQGGDDQLCWLANWCREEFGVENNDVIGKEGWPRMLVEVVAKAVEDRLGELDDKIENLGESLRRSHGAD